MKVFQRIVLMVLFIIYGTTSLDFNDCGSLFHLSNLEVGTCNDEDVSTCQIYIGQNTTISFTLDSGNQGDIAKLTTEVYLFLRGVRFNLTVTPNDPCAVVTCPISTNYITNYTATIQVNEDFLPIFGELVWMTKSDFGQPLIWFDFPVLIQLQS